MTTAVQTRQPAGRPTGGQFSAHTRSEDIVELGVGFGDTLSPVDAAEMRAVVDTSFDAIDSAFVAELHAKNDIEDATAGGMAHAHAEAIAYLTYTGDEPIDYEARAEDMLNDRREGDRLEDERGPEWPGSRTAFERQTAVDHFRARADELWMASQVVGIAPDVQAHFYARFETFSDLALDLSSPGGFPQRSAA